MKTFKYRRFRNSRDNGALLNIAPLIDIVFLLLLFFISTSKFGDIHSNVSSGLSIKDLPQAKVVNKVENKNIIISIFRNKEIKINNKSVEIQNFEKDLTLTMSDLKSERIIISSDKMVDLGFIISIIGRAKSVGIKEVNIASIPDIR